LLLNRKFIIFLVDLLLSKFFFKNIVIFRIETFYTPKKIGIDLLISQYSIF
jgi:hypothetical protein